MNNLKIGQLNRWRELYNPLRGLTMQTAIGWLEAAQRGIFADIQWAYSFIERRDADMIALIERRSSALLEMDWTIKPIQKERMPAGVTQADIDAQAEQLQAAYEKIENLYEAIEHLALASFRGFAFCQPQLGDNPDFCALPGIADRFEILDQWNFARARLKGGWRWNPEARAVPAESLKPEDDINMATMLFREVRRPINEIALIKFLRQNLSQKDWDAFIEIYGIPGWIVVMPPNVPDDKKDDYRAAAESVATGGSGALPNGSDAKCADQPRGVSPFRDHLDYLSEKLVLAGTGGLLTMLTAPGSGTLAGSAHMEAFETIARAEARKISEVFQKQYDKPIINRLFPGKPVLAYFNISANEEQDVGEIITHASTLSTAGYMIAPEELTEKTGYKITLKPTTTTPPLSVPADGLLPNNRVRGRSLTRERPGPIALALQKLRNSEVTARQAFQALAADKVAQAVSDDLKPVRDRLEYILKIDDEELRNNALINLQRELPKMLKEMNANPAAAQPIEDALSTAMLNGLAEEQS